MKKSIVTILIAATLLFGALPAAPFAAFAAEPVTYYISSSEGDDANGGTSQDSPWKSFANLKNKVLQPGEKVLLKRGDVWQDRLEIMGQGTEDAYVEVGAYGDETLGKPTIRQNGDRDDIAVLVKDFYYDGSKVVKENMRYIRISDLNIEDTRMGIYVRTYLTNNDGQNRNIEISDCTFHNIDSVEVMEELNKFVEEVEAMNPQPSPNYPDDPYAFDSNVASKIGTTISEKIAALLNEPKGDLPYIQNGEYKETGGGASEYIFPAAVFVGGDKDPIQPEKPETVENAKPALQYFSVENCEMDECIAGVMSWYYAYNGTVGSNGWRETLKYVRVQDVTITGAVNGGLAMNCVDGGAVLNEEGDGMQPNEEGWGEIRNFRVLSGSDKPYHTFPNGTTGAIFESSKNFLITECEFSGMTNQGNADGCGFDFESNCENIELSYTVMQNNEGGAILIMDNGNGYHKNLFIHDNLMYTNLQHAFAAGNNRNNNIEVAYVHIYNAGNQNVRLENNTILMQESIRTGSTEQKYKIHAVGPKPATEPDGTVNFIWQNNVEKFYEGGNRVDLKTYFEGTLDAQGKIVLDNVWLHSNIYRAMRISVNGSGSVKGTVQAQSNSGLLSSQQAAAFTAEDGYVDIGALSGVRWNIPYKKIEVAVEGGKSGDKYELEFVPDTQIAVEKLSDTQLSVTLEGESKAVFADDVSAEMFTLHGKAEKCKVLSAEKTGLYRVVLTLDQPLSEGTFAVTLRNDAFITCFDEIFSGTQPDSTVNKDSWYYPVSVEITKLPQKRNYEQGEELDLMGLKLTLRNGAGEEESLSPAKCTVSGFDSNTPGRQTVTLRYKNSIAMFDVQVMEGGSSQTGGGCSGAVGAGCAAGVGLGLAALGAAALATCRKRKKQ